MYRTPFSIITNTFSEGSSSLNKNKGKVVEHSDGGGRNLFKEHFNPAITPVPHIDHYQLGIQALVYTLFMYSVGSETFHTKILFFSEESVIRDGTFCGDDSDGSEC